MAGYNNYTIQFQNYIAYNGISNKTVLLYLVKNTTFTFSPPPLWYVPINITNTNDTATPKNFQAMVKINWSAYSKYLLPSLSNVRFYNSTSFTLSHELAAWMENNNTLKAYSSIVWVNMSGTIIAGKSSVKIYMVFGPTTENFGKHWGEAPQLSGTYGQYDNGAKVFSNYWNFAGAAVPSGWINNGGTVTVNNGVTFAVTSSYVFYYNVSISGSNIVDGLAKNIVVPTVSDHTNDFVGFTASPIAWIGSFTGARIVTTNTVSWVINGAYGSTSLIYPASSFFVFGGGGDSSTQNSYFNYTNIKSSSVAMPSTYYPGIEVDNGATMFLQWIRVRAYPPNGVMPLQVNKTSSTVNITEGLII